jgi:hypothetical protein
MRIMKVCADLNGLEPKTRGARVVFLSLLINRFKLYG